MGGNQSAMIADQNNNGYIPTETEPAAPALAPRYALVAFLLTILLLILIPLILLLPLQVLDHPLGNIASTGLAMLGATLITIRVSGVPLSVAIPQGRLSVKAVCGCILIGVGLFSVSASSIGRLYESYDGGYLEYMTEMLESVTELVGPFGLFVLLGFMAPIWEELLFRGVILQALLTRWSTWLAIAVSSVLFGLIHLHPVHGVIALVIGIALGAATVVTGSIWAAILIHIVNNVLAGLAAMVMAMTDYLPVWLIVPGIILAGGGLFLICRDSREPDAAHIRRSLREPDTTRDVM